MCPVAPIKTVRYVSTSYVYHTKIPVRRRWVWVVVDMVVVGRNVALVY